jgi:hypothetical protein
LRAKTASRQWALNAALLLVSIAISLICVELALRFIIQPRALMTKEFLIRQGVTESDQAWERSDLLGWIIKSNATFNHASPFGEFNVAIRTGYMGLRLPLEGARANLSSAKRTILFVGDSVTAGYEVEYDETFVAKVEKILSANGNAPVRTLNAGIRGYSTDQSFKRMKQLLDAGIKPDDIVYVYSLNDPFENMSVHFPKRLMSKPGSYLDDAGDLRFRSLNYPVGIFDSEALFVEPGGNIGTLPVLGHGLLDRRIVNAPIRYQEGRSSFDKFYLYGVIKSAWQIYTERRVRTDEVERKYPYIKVTYITNPEGGFMPGFIDVSWEPHSYPLQLLEKLVVEMKAAVEGRGIRFWLALPMTMLPETSAYFENLAHKYDLRVIDPIRMGLVQKWVDKCGGNLTWKFDGHYNPCGHSGQADAIVSAMSKLPSQNSK